MQRVEEVHKALRILCRGHYKESGASWLPNLLSVGGPSFRLTFSVDCEAEAAAEGKQKNCERTVGILTAPSGSEARV